MYTRKSPVFLLLTHPKVFNVLPLFSAGNPVTGIPVCSQISASRRGKDLTASKYDSNGMNRKMCLVCTHAHIAIFLESQSCGKRAYPEGSQICLTIEPQHLEPT